MNVIRGSATLDDDEYPFSGEAVYDGFSETYTRSYTCSTNLGDYTDGADLDNQVVNIAEVYSEGALEDSSTATTEIDCYIPSILKTAAGTYDERHEWDVEKTVNPESQSAFAGDTVTFDWTVTVDETVFEENFDVSGSITVNNPNPEDALVVPLTDELNDGTEPTISGCNFDGTDLTVAAGGSETCTFAANDLSYSDVTQAPNNNTASIVLNGITFPADDAIEWTVSVIRESALVTDDQGPLNETLFDDATFTIPDSYTCSSDVSLYAGDGTYLYTEDNTAIVYSGGVEQDRDSASTTVNCYAPIVSKDAFTSFDRTWSWTIDKDADATEITLLTGDSAVVNYTIVLDATSADSNWAVVGTITVENPNPSASMTVSLSDVLNDSTVATLDCGGSLTIPAGGSASCGYNASPTAAASLNTATATLNGIDFAGTEPVDWGAATINYIDEEVTVTDDYGTPGDTSDDLTWIVNVLTDGVPYTITYSRTFSVADFPFCGDHYVINTASFLTNELLRSGSESWTVLFRIPCEEGLTPGYWKNHLDDWVVYEPADVIESVFDNVPADLQGTSLLDALKWPGGDEVEDKAQLLLHHAVAAVLNAAHPNIDYPWSVVQIVDAVNAALASGDPDVMLDLKDMLDMWNNYGADISS